MGGRVGTQKSVGKGGRVGDAWVVASATRISVGKGGRVGDACGRVGDTWVVASATRISVEKYVLAIPTISFSTSVVNSHSDSFVVGPIYDQFSISFTLSYTQYRSFVRYLVDTQNSLVLGL